MGYSIQPVQIWQNGQSETGNYIDASIVNDNLLIAKAQKQNKALRKVTLQ
jgi:hypothetical protein